VHHLPVAQGGALHDAGLIQAQHIGGGGVGHGHVVEGGGRQGGGGQLQGLCRDLRDGVTADVVVQVALRDGAAGGQQPLPGGQGQVAAGPVAAGLGGLAVARGQQDQLQGLGVGDGGVRGVGGGRHAVNDAGLRQIHHRGVVPVGASHVGKALGVGGPHRDLSGAGQGAVSGVDGEGDIHRAALTGSGSVLDVVHVLQVVAQIELVIGGDGAAGAAVGQGAGGGLGEGDIGVPAGGGAQQVLKVAGPEAHTGEPRGVAHRQVPPAEVHLPDVQQLPGGAVGHVPEAVGETVAGHVGQIVDHVAPTAAVIEEVVVQVPLPQGAVPAGAGVV